MLKFARRLPVNATLVLDWCGQSNGRPWGHRDLEGFPAEPQLKLSPAGQSLSLLALSGTSGLVTAYVAESMTSTDYYRGADFRFIGQDYGNSVVNARVGRAVVRNSALPVTAAAASIAANTITTTAAHGLVAGDVVLFTGTTPTGLSVSTPYWVIAGGLTTTAFQVSLTSGGAAIALGALTGALTVTCQRILLQILTATTAVQAATTVTFAGGGSSTINWAAHALLPGDLVQFTSTATLPPGITAGTTYFVQSIGAGTLTIATTRGGAAMTFATAGSGTITGFARQGSYVHLAQTDISFVVTMANGSASVTKATNHGLQNGDRVSFSVSGAGALPSNVVAGTLYYVQNVAATTFEITTGIGTASIVAATGSSAVMVATPQLAAAPQVKGEPWKTYENVEVLTPYQPETQADYPPGAPAIPGYTFPASVASYADCGLILPFAWNEGVEGIGGRYSGIGSTTFTSGTAVIAAAGLTPSLYVGAYIICGGVSGTVIENDATTLTLRTNWSATPAAGSEIEFGVFHWRDSPYRALYGFRYPSNDRQPGGEGNIAAQTVPGAVYNRPRGVLAGAYVIPDIGGVQQYRFGALIVAAMRLANKLGRKVCVNALAINSAGQFYRNTNNAFGVQGTIGWWQDDANLDWTPSNPNGIFARYARMHTTMLPGAVAAQGRGPAYVMAINCFQGEADALVASGRDIYDDTLSAFYTELRRTIVAAGQSPYASSVKIPAVHAKITTVPWCLTGTYTYYGIPIVFNGDTAQEVNAAIAKFAAVDGWATSIETDVSGNPLDATTYKLNGTTPFGTDLGHFNGAGEARNGRNMADATATLINTALQVGADDSFTIDVCNLALSHLGDTAVVSSLDPTVDASAQAAHCARYYPMARDATLALRPWTFARRRVALVAVTNNRPEWTYAYAVPSDVLVAMAVTPSDAPDDWVTQFSQPGSFLVNPDPNLNLATAVVPQDYTIEADSDGNRVLYTNQLTATLRYLAIATDASMYPPLFKQALGWQLAAMLAGPIIKGDAGAAEAKRCLGMLSYFLGQAAEIDANQQQQNPKVAAPWIRKR